MVAHVVVRHVSNSSHVASYNLNLPHARLMVCRTGTELMQNWICMSNSSHVAVSNLCLPHARSLTSKIKSLMLHVKHLACGKCKFEPPTCGVFDIASDLSYIPLGPTAAILKDLLLKIHRVNPPKIFVRIEHLLIQAVGWYRAPCQTPRTWQLKRSNIQRLELSNAQSARKFLVGSLCVFLVTDP